MLVGRDALLEVADAALRGALDGRGRVVLLSGEAGIGKTTMASEVVARAEAAGALVRTGACWESDRMPPFAPWLAALHQPGGDECAIAAAQLEGSGGDAASDASVALRARGRRFALVVDALRSAARQRPQVVLLEDLHWADGESLELLVAVAAHVPSMAVLVIGTYRDDELASRSVLASIGGNADRLPLDGLDADAVAEVLESVLGRTPTGDERDNVLRQTAGNPLFVTQVARLLDVGSSALPTGVRDVLGRRLARTSSSCARALGAASVVGVEFEQLVVEAMLGGSVSDELDEAEGAGLVARADDAPGHWRFVHALVQAARYDALATHERSGLHRAAVDALGRSRRASPATLAHHALRGSFPPDDPRPAELLVAAGAEALARMAWSDAASAFEHALRIVPPGDDAAAVAAEAWLGIGSVRLRHGQGDVRAAFDEAAAAGRRAGRVDLVARAALGFSVGLGAFEVKMLDHHQIELLEDAASQLPSDHPLLPLVLARLSVSLAFVESDDRRVGLAEQAVDLARRSGDPLVLGHALAAWCDAVSGPDFVEERLVAAGEVIVLAGRAGDLPLELLGRRLRVVALMERLDHSAVRAEVAVYERTAEALGDPLYAWFGSLWRATLAFADGDTAGARALLDEARDLGSLGGSTNSWLLADVSDLMSAIDRRERGRTERAMEGMLSHVPDLLTPYADITAAYVEVALGDVDRARLLLGGLSPSRLDELPRDSEWVCAMTQVGYAAARAGRVDLARHVRRQLAPVASCAAVEGIGAYVHGSVHRTLALVAAVDDDVVAVRTHVAAARAAAAGGGAVLEALTDLDGAWALGRSDDPDDRQRAGTLAERAADSLRRAGLVALADEAAALGRPGGGTSAPSSDATAPLVASVVRTGDSWAWTWGGTTVHVRHAKGVADLAVLLERAGREVHVRELEGAGHLPAVGSAQAALDPEAVRRYRDRLAELEDDLEEAERHADAGRAERLAVERDALVTELTRAFGLGDRPRGAGSDPDERLRKAVSARVRASIERIEQLHPALGRHLRAGVRTGFWCCYEPEHHVDWSVSRT